jgi:hypothetical protein
VISEQTGRECQHDSCESIPVERMRWFTGRFVTARDLTDEQRYMVQRRWLINRMLHGEGVLCGLEVVPHERDDCAATTVWIEPGIALDCRGRELISPCRLCVTWPSPAEPGCDPPRHEEKLLVIRYCEEAVDPQYAMLSDCTCQGGKEASRIREQVAWKLAGRDELLHCWPDEHPLVHDDCDERSGGHSGCIEPYCRCDGWVPLAVLTRREGGPIHISDLLVGRLPAAGYLTKISRINWPHGGELELDELIERRGRLEVDFDRPLLEADSDARGINQFTFRVQYGGLERNLEFLPSPEDSPALEDRTKAVFTIERGLWDRESHPPKRRETWQSSLRGSFVIVTLLCDFILDCHGNPVDGDHLRGRLPSGSGTPGGVFRSWFAVS